MFIILCLWEVDMPRAKPRLALFGHEASVEILAQLSSEHTVTD